MKRGNSHIHFNVAPLVVELLLLLSRRDGGVSLHTDTGILLVLLSWRDGGVSLGTDTGILLVLDLSSTTVLDRDDLSVGGSETSGHDGGPGGHDLLRVDGAVELGPGEEVLQQLLDDWRLGQSSDNDDVRDGALVGLGPLQGLPDSGENFLFFEARTSRFCPPQQDVSRSSPPGTSPQRWTSP